MIYETVNTMKTKKLFLGIVGGGPKSWIGHVHRISARFDNKYEIVAGVFSRNSKLSANFGQSIGIEKVFEVDQSLVLETEWFDDEIIGTKHGDFFVKRSINYSKRSQSITNDDLF